MPPMIKTLLKSPVKVGFALLAALIIAGSCWGLLQRRPPVPDPLLPYVKLESKWTLREFNDFTAALDQDRRNSLKKALKIGGKKYNSKDEEITAIRRQFQWDCYKFVPYICDPPPEFSYHEITQWIAGKLKLDKNPIAKMTTFELERKILEATFAMMWDKLTPEQRAKVLECMDKDKSLDRAGIAAMSGAGAIAALSTTVYLFLYRDEFHHCRHRQCCRRDVADVGLLDGIQYCSIAVWTSRLGNCRSGSGRRVLVDRRSGLADNRSGDHSNSLHQNSGTV